MHSIFFWGSKFIDCLSDYLGDDIYIKNKMIDISPISDHYYSRIIDRMIEWRKEIEERWREEKPEYLVLDLRTVQQFLFQNENYLTAWGPGMDPSKIVMPESFFGKKMYRKLILFIEIILSYFDSSHIILIRTHVPKYYVIGTQLRNNKQYKKQIQSMQIVKKAESYFLKKTGAVVIDLTRFYFYEKETGFVLTDYIYETECFQDLSEKLSSYILGDRENKEKPDRPDFSTSLRRYCKYYDCTILFDAFTTFLREQNLLESMILSSPKDFVSSHYEELLDLHRRIPDSVNLEEVNLEYIHSDVVKILRAHDAIRREDYANEAIDYALLFHNRVISQSLLLNIKRGCQEQGIVNSKLINYYNAGYYFARMQGLAEEDAMAFVKRKTVLKPVLVDIFGSCITRSCFRDRFTNNQTCAVNN